MRRRSDTKRAAECRSRCRLTDGGNDLSPKAIALSLIAWALCEAIYAQAGTSDHRPRIAAAAESQVGVTRSYDPAYRRLAYPGGDVPLDRGVCTDVVIRAFRRIGIDLQVEVHEDIRANFQRYPQLWRLRGPDKNIDHRRVPNLMFFFDRKGKSVPLNGTYEPGDIVAWRLPNGLLHIGIVSRSRNESGRPLVVHNIGGGAQLEDVLHSFEKIGHYRW
jgi:uncharacterized protein